MARSDFLVENNNEVVEMKDSDFKRMKHPTFIVEVKGTANSSWQGVLTWVDGQKKQSFRSTLELLRLLDSTIDMEDEE